MLTDAIFLTNKLLTQVNLNKLPMQDGDWLFNSM